MCTASGRVLLFLLIRVGLHRLLKLGKSPLGDCSHGKVHFWVKLFISGRNCWTRVVVIIQHMRTLQAQTSTLVICICSVDCNYFQFDRVGWSKMGGSKMEGGKPNHRNCCHTLSLPDISRSFWKLFFGRKLHGFFFETWHMWSQVLIKQVVASVIVSLPKESLE